MNRIDCFAVAVRELMRDYHVASHVARDKGFGFAVLRAHRGAAIARFE